jgi:hypothetical protein
MRLLHAGILMSLDWYLRDMPTGRGELREFLSGHLCRCTGYVPIVAAALDAAKGCAMLDLGTSFLQRRARPRRSRSSTALRSPMRNGTGASQRGRRVRSLGLVRAIISSPCCQTASRPRPCTGPASSRRHHHAVTARERRRPRFLLRDADAKASSYEVSSRRCALKERQTRPASRSATARDIAFEAARGPAHSPASPRCVVGDALHLQVPRRGPKGVPRRQRAERAAALAACGAETCYRQGTERTLERDAALYTPWGTLALAMSLIGRRVRVPARFDAAARARLIAARRSQPLP